MVLFTLDITTKEGERERSLIRYCGKCTEIFLLVIFTALFGVPFVVNKRYLNAGESATPPIPTFSKKSRQQIEDEVRGAAWIKGNRIVWANID